MTSTSTTADNTTDQLLDVVIVGSGFSGLAAAVETKQRGISNWLMLEKSDDVGGVWRENTYPGAACDVPWHLYSFSFFRKSGFSRRYPHQDEILGYQQDCARHFDLYENAIFGVEVVSATWQHNESHWLITAKDGRTWRSRAVVMGVGQLSRPGWPNIPGRDSFKGDSFHSAVWDHSIPLKGRKVGVIGTGASAIQFIPHVAEDASELTVFQRSAPYLLPRIDGLYGSINRALFRSFPGYERPFRYLLWKSGEMSTVAFDQPGSKTAELYHKVSMWHLNRQIKDDALREKLTPDYTIGCKRILFSSNYYPALQQPHVSLETKNIKRITKDGITLEDGSKVDLDVIIYGTGFKATEFLSPIEITGRDGKALSDEWQQGAEAYKGITVPHFPNLFLMYGPNTNLGGNSIIYMIECQMRYVGDALSKLQDHSWIAVKPEVARHYNDQLQQRLSHTVWATGCESWYHNAAGRITNNWPGRTAEYRKLTKKVDLNDYELG